MMEQKNNVDAILFHIEHSKPIEISEFVTSLNAIGNLFSLFAKKNGDCKECPVRSPSRFTPANRATRTF